MTKEIAERIMRIGIEITRLENDRYHITKSLGLVRWDDAQTAALKFLLEEQNVNP